jgi:hypothetical protein
MKRAVRTGVPVRYLDAAAGPRRSHLVGAGPIPDVDDYLDPVTLHVFTPLVEQQFDTHPEWVET